MQPVNASYLEILTSVKRLKINNDQEQHSEEGSTVPLSQTIEKDQKQSEDQQKLKEQEALNRIDQMIEEYFAREESFNIERMYRQRQVDEADRCYQFGGRSPPQM